MAQTGSNRSLQTQGGDLLLLPPPAGGGGAGEAATIEADYVLLPAKPASAPERVIRAPGPTAKPMLQRPGHDAKAFDGMPAEDLAALTKGLRRRWLSAGFKRSQHTILLLRVSGEAAEGRRVAKALGAALAPLGDVYPFGPMGQALIAPEKPVRHIVKIAQSIRATVMGAEDQTVRLSAGVALIHRDDDTMYTLCTAERNLREAEAAPEGGVVTGADLMAPGRDAGEVANG